MLQFVKGWQAAGMTPSEYGIDPVENLAELVRQGIELM